MPPLKINLVTAPILQSGRVVREDGICEVGPRLLKKKVLIFFFALGVEGAIIFAMEVEKDEICGRAFLKSV